MNTLQKFIKTARFLSPKYLPTIASSYSINIFEPDYLEALKPKIPIYEPLNIEVKGYDYPLLESYQKLIHRIAKNMDVNVEDSWALPHLDMNISTFKPNSEVVENQYSLKVYRRTIQIADCPTTQLPILLRAIEAGAPAGVTVNVVRHTELHDEERYIPDKELLNLKETLESMGGSKEKKKNY